MVGLLELLGLHVVVKILSVLYGFSLCGLRYIWMYILLPFAEVYA